MSWRTPVLPRLRATLVALVAAIASALLMGLNAVVGALACGDDGALDYGTGGVAAKSYCQASFDDGHFSTVFISFSLLALTAAAVTAALLIVTRQRLWLYSSLTLLALLGAWAVWLVVFL